MLPRKFPTSTGINYFGSTFRLHVYSIASLCRPGKNPAPNCLSVDTAVNAQGRGTSEGGDGLSTTDTSQAMAWLPLSSGLIHASSSSPCLEESKRAPSDIRVNNWGTPRANSRCVTVSMSHCPTSTKISISGWLSVSSLRVRPLFVQLTSSY